MYHFLKNILSIATPSGFEQPGLQKIADLAMQFADGFFDKYRILPSGSVLLSHNAKNSSDSAKTLVLDAHADTVGFVVSEHHKDGFVKAVALGGIDPYILPATPVELYGKKTVCGVFTSVPPHLAGKTEKALELSDLYIDTGLSKEERNELVPIGTPVGFAYKPALLQNNRVTSPYLDDKACIAVILYACKILAKRRRAVDINLQVHLSTGEEKTALGAKTLFHALPTADACLVLDVNFGRASGVKDYEALELGKGGGISYSAAIKREFTEFIADTAQKSGIPLQKVVEMRSTGTNATQIHRQGIPCAVLSLPLLNMHTPVECVSLSDMTSMAELLVAVVDDFSTASLGEVHFK